MFFFCFFFGNLDNNAFSMIAMCLAMKLIFIGNDDENVSQLKRTRGRKGQGQHMTRVTRCDCNGDDDDDFLQ